MNEAYHPVSTPRDDRSKAFITARKSIFLAAGISAPQKLQPALSSEFQEGSVLSRSSCFKTRQEFFLKSHEFFGVTASPVSPSFTLVNKLHQVRASITPKPIAGFRCVGESGN